MEVSVSHSWCVYKQEQIAQISDQHLNLVSLKAKTIKGYQRILRLNPSSETSIPALKSTTKSGKEMF